MFKKIKENIEWFLSDEYWDDNEYMEDIKQKMCGENKFGDFFAPFWETTGCTCCAFFRGMLIGSFTTILITGLLSWVMN